MISRSSRRVGASDRNSRRAMNDTTMNSRVVACQPASSAADSKPIMTTQLAIRWRSSV